MRAAEALRVSGDSTLVVEVVGASAVRWGGAAALVAGLVSLALVMSCGSSSPARSRPGTVVRAPVAAAPRYSTDSLSATAPAREPALVAAIRAARLPAGAEPPVHDPRLTTLAGWLLDRYDDGRDTPPREVVDFLAQTLGVVDPTPAVFLVGVDGPASLDEAVASMAAEQLARRPYNRFGVATATHGSQRLALVVLTSRRVRLEPVARAGEPGRAIVVRGELGPGFTYPTVAVTSPSGRVRSIPAGEGPGFDVRVPAAERGTYQLEVIGRGELGETVLANFPVHRGVAPPDHVVVAPPASGEQDPRTVERELLVLLNGARRRARLPPLEAMEALGQVARAHSREMVDAGYMGHRSPRHGDAGDRLRRAGIQSGVVLENIGRAYSAREIHDGLMASPGHRANILSPRITHVGVGVASETEGGRMAFVATEVFVRVSERLDLSRAPSRLLEGINARRQALGRRPVRLDASLSQRAQAGAEAFFRGGGQPPGQEAVLDEVNESLRRFSLAYSRIGAVMAIVTAVDDAAALEPVLDEGPQVVGIGLAQGDRPDLGRVIAVVVVLGWPR